MTTAPISVPRPTAEDVRRARERIGARVLRTPASHSKTLSAMCGCEVIVKYENLQFTSSYKERGALNRLLTLSADERRSGVVTASAGNFAQGLAHHASLLGIGATVVMPVGTPATKVSRTRAHGPRISITGASFEESQEHARSIAIAEGRVFISPFDDLDVVAGQGTVALELLEQHPDLDVVIVPVGGGGLLAGMAVATEGWTTRPEWIGVQSERFSPVASTFHPEIVRVTGATLAEGIAVSSPGAIGLGIIADLVTDVVTVEEVLIEQAICTFAEVERVIVEGAGAAGLALLSTRPERFAGRKVAIIASGGNIDLQTLASVFTRGLRRAGRVRNLRFSLPDRPGALGEIATIVGNSGVNILRVDQDRAVMGVHLKDVQIELLVETSDSDEMTELIAVLDAAGFTLQE